MQIKKSSMSINPFTGSFNLKFYESISLDFVIYLEKKLRCKSLKLASGGKLFGFDVNIFHPFWQIESVEWENDQMEYEFRDYKFHSFLVVAGSLFFLGLKLLDNDFNFAKSIGSPLIIFLFLMFFFWGGKIVYYFCNIKYLEKIMKDFNESSSK